MAVLMRCLAYQVPCHMNYYYKMALITSIYLFLFPFFPSLIYNTCRFGLCCYKCMHTLFKIKREREREKRINWACQFQYCYSSFMFVECVSVCECIYYTRFGVRKYVLQRAEKKQSILNVTYVEQKNECNKDTFAREFNSIEIGSIYIVASTVPVAFNMHKTCVVRS